MQEVDTLRVLAEAAQDQWGLFTRQQAVRLGVPQTTFARLVASASVIERVAHGVYKFVAAPLPQLVELRAAWMQLAPETFAWRRTAAQGLVSHRSAAALYGIGELPADRHEFTFFARKQNRRADVRIHRRSNPAIDRTRLGGMLVTRPSRIAADLLADREDSGAIARMVAESIREAYDTPMAFVETLAPFSGQLGLRPGDNDGHRVLNHLLDVAAGVETTP